MCDYSIMEKLLEGTQFKLKLVIKVNVYNSVDANDKHVLLIGLKQN